MLGLPEYNHTLLLPYMNAEEKQEKSRKFMPDNPKDLTLQQHKFVKEYLTDFKGKQAAIRAGYSPKTADQQASRLLKLAKVKAVVEKGMKDHADRLQITTDKVVAELGRIAFGNPERDSDKLKALELLGKHLGMFQDVSKVEHSGTIEGAPGKFEIVIVDAAGEAVQEDGEGEDAP